MRVVSPPIVHSVRPSLTEAKVPIPLPEVEDISEPEIDPGSLGLICSWQDQNSQLNSGHTIEFRE